MNGVVTPATEGEGMRGTMAGEVTVDLDARRMSRMTVEMTGEMQTPRGGTQIRTRVMTALP